MIRLAPSWAHHYGEFWRAIRIRNLWFIRLRYLAVFILLGFLVSGEALFNFELTSAQISVILIISSIILAYNIVFHLTKDLVGNTPGKFNALHFSLIQIVLDLTALMMLVYFTGMNYSPLYMFFIFHMIIGSLILPGNVIYTCAGYISVVFGILTYLQHNDIIPLHTIKGLTGGLQQHRYSHDLLFQIVFSFVLFVSVYIANKIARQLYQREQQLRSTLEKLEEAEKAKQKYTIGVVHEIKTPIVALESIIDLLLQRLVGPIDDAVEQKLLRVKLRSEEALALINNILRFSRLKLLDVTTLEELNVAALFNLIIDTHLEEIKSKNVQVKYKDDRKENRNLLGDTILLELAFSNLIGNAIKYSPEGSTVEIKISDEGEELIVIDITDDGIGIPQGDLERIFNQFYRASNIDKSKIEGSGMGLAIVKEIIERHNGVITVISPSRLAKEGFLGTTFILKLPYKPKEKLKEPDFNLEDYL